MRENLSLSYLGSRYHKNYTELGYSISEVLFLGEIGVYVGFEDLKYKSVGAKLVFQIQLGNAPCPAEAGHPPKGGLIS